MKNGELRMENGKSIRRPSNRAFLSYQAEIAEDLGMPGDYFKKQSEISEKPDSKSQTFQDST
jgi:hypothetical protein